MINANSIKSKSFETERSGYSQSQVDKFLAEVANDYAAIAAENAENEEKIAKLVEKISEYREEEDAIKQALLSAQKEANKIINDAKKAETERQVWSNHNTLERGNAKKTFKGEL